MRVSLGDQQAMAYVRVGNMPTAGMADTGSRRSVMDRGIAEAGGAVATGRRGTLNIAGHKLRGDLMRVSISVPHTSCRTSVEAFVPDAGQPFRKGLILGMDFLQKAKMRIDAETGEAYCPVRRR